MVRGSWVPRQRFNRVAPKSSVSVGRHVLPTPGILPLGRTGPKTERPDLNHGTATDQFQPPAQQLHLRCLSGALGCAAQATTAFLRHRTSCTRALACKRGACCPPLTHTGPWSSSVSGALAAALRAFDLRGRAAKTWGPISVLVSM